MRIFYGWHVALTAFLIFMFTNGMSLFVPQNLFPRFMETFGASAAEISLTTAITLGTAGLLAPLIGVVIDRFGVIRIIRAGLIVLAICFSLYPFARSVTDLYVLHMGMALGLVLAGLMSNVVLLSNWFIALRGRAIGALIAASSLGGALLPLIISPIVNHPDYGWRWGYGALAGAFWLLALIPGFIILKETPQSVGCLPDGADKPSGPTNDQPARDGVTFRIAIRSRTLYCLAIGSACLWFSIQAMNSQVTIFFEQEAGLSPQRATLLFSTLFWMSFIGKFIFGAVSDYYAKRHVMLIASLILLGGCLLLFTPAPAGIGLTNDLARLIIFTVVFGLGYGGSFTMIQLVCIESFGQQALGKILGIITFIDAMGAAAGTFMAGQLQTATGDYLLPFGIVTVIAAIAVINVLFIRPVAAGRPA
jgi:sugar phosphate permease